jgi:quinol-cytochrome oxidoreductase complex cytochrome b subunit
LIRKKINPSFSFSPLNRLSYWIFVVITLLLTWIGANAVETPYVLVGQVLTVRYFRYFILSPFLQTIWPRQIHPSR